TIPTRSDFFCQAEDVIRSATVTGVQTCALPICSIARDGLLAALAGDPGFLALERAIERFDFADVAAAFAQLLALIERIAAETRDVLGDGIGVGMEYVHLVAVAGADRGDHVERIGVQPLRVECEDLDAQLVPEDDV